MCFNSSTLWLRDYLARHPDFFGGCPRCGRQPAVSINRRSDFDVMIIVMCPFHPTSSIKVTTGDLVKAVDQATSRWTALRLRHNAAG